jgi:hypothetical protein
MADETNTETVHGPGRWKHGAGKIGEIIFGGLTVANTLHDILDTLFKTHETLPPETKRMVAKWFGWSLDDERLINQDIETLKPKQKEIIGRFLYDKCKDFQRNRFVVLVGGMEDIPGKPRVVEKTQDGKKRVEKITDAIPGVNKRKIFLEGFANLILDKFNGDLDMAYNHAFGRRLIMENPWQQEIIDKWTSSCTWFKNIILNPFGAVSVEDLLQRAKQKLSKNSADLNQSTQSFEDRARTFYERSRRRS